MCIVSLTVDLVRTKAPSERAKTLLNFVTLLVACFTRHLFIFIAMSAVFICKARKREGSENRQLPLKLGLMAENERRTKKNSYCLQAQMSKLYA